MACRALDGQVARPKDKELPGLLEQFVCVRLIQGWGADLAVFQFDFDLTWAVFFLNADKTVYGRYGTRAEFDGMKSISIPGFKKALQGALELHKLYPENKESLAGKTSDDYGGDALLQSAVERQFVTIGEALAQLARLDAALSRRIPDLARIVAF